MTREVSSGGIVFREEPDLAFLMILDGYGRWTFPKGLVETGETPEEAAVREVEEETGLRTEVAGELGQTRYVYHHPRKGRVHKTVTFYLLRLTGGCLTPQTGEIAAAEWVSPEEAARRVDYEGYDRLVAAALRTLGRTGY
ncbi:MAG: NUDIX domain-containing protein [Bacillota bacterium]|jgi:8-oxo-dGTP pyrophosphatase MutT (NUDIX family)